MTQSISVGTARPPRIYASILGLISLALLAGGIYLAILCGSPYYLIAGAVILACAVLLWRGSRRGAQLYWLMLIATLLWSFWEVGLNGWALVPRLLLPTLLGLWLLTPWVRRGLA